MYKIILTHKFKRSLRKIKKSGKQGVLEINKVSKTIASGQKLGSRFKDHKLHGGSLGIRECHIKDDLLLIYRKDKENLVLILINIGSHDDLFK